MMKRNHSAIAKKAWRTRKRMAMKRKTNGKRRGVRSSHSRTREAYERVLKAARRHGMISNDMACDVGGFAQGWYHLNAMKKAGMLKRKGFNQWVPTR